LSGIGGPHEVYRKFRYLVVYVAADGRLTHVGFDREKPARSFGKRKAAEGRMCTILDTKRKTVREVRAIG